MILAAACLAASVASAQSLFVPTRGMLQQAKTWTFLTPDDRRLVTEIEASLASERWAQAASQNDLLLRRLPAEALDPSRPMPLMQIGPAGSVSEPPPAQKPADGWQWRLEIGWLYVYGRSFAAGQARFRDVAESAAPQSARAVEAEAMAMIRQGRYAAARDRLAARRMLAPDWEQMLNWASTPTAGAIQSLRGLAFSAPVSSSSPGASLRGPIGGGMRLRQVLPPVRGGGALPPPTPPAKPAQAITTAGIEAALILAEWSIRDRDWANARLCLARVSATAREAMPHHRRMAAIYQASLPR